MGLRCPFGHDKAFREQEGLDNPADNNSDTPIKSAQEKAALFEDYVQGSLQAYAQDGFKPELLRISPLQHVVMIWAEDKNSKIGSPEDIPWHVPADRTHFKSCTMGHAVIMGRRTYESIGTPLEGRRIVIISRQKDYQAPGCEVVNSPQEALDLLAQEREIWIAGGKQIYDAFIHVAKELVVSYLDLESSASIDAPYILPTEWSIEAAKSDPSWREVSGDAAWRVVCYRRTQSSWIYTSPALYS